MLYDLRHTFATRMIAAGVDIMTLKDIMGHEDIRVTQKYIHPTKDRQKAMATYAASAMVDQKYTDFEEDSRKLGIQ